MTRQPLIARPAVLLQVEAACLLIASFVGYSILFPHHWVLFAALCLVPDLALLSFLKGPTAAASVVYNVVHSYVLPLVLGMSALLFRNALMGEVSLIWIAHISFDRMIAAGLKYPGSFRFTHIQSAIDPVIKLTNTTATSRAS